MNNEKQKERMGPHPMFEVKKEDMFNERKKAKAVKSSKSAKSFISRILNFFFEKQT